VVGEQTLVDAVFRHSADVAPTESRDRLVWVCFKVRYDVKLAKYYCWAQTARFVYVSVFIPTGYADKQLHFQVRRRWSLVPHRMGGQSSRRESRAFGC
jgi:hypothetical protein